MRLIWLCLLAACTHAVHVDQLRLHPLGPPEPDHKLTTPVYLAEVRSELPEPARFGDTSILARFIIEAYELPTFVRRDLVTELERLFATVRVGEPPARCRNCIVLRAKLERIVGFDGRKPLQLGSFHMRAILDWSVAITMPGGGYTYRNRVEGPHSRDPSAIVRGVLETALVQFTSELYVKGMEVAGRLSLKERQ